MRVIVCGGRTFGLSEDECKFVHSQLNSILYKSPYDRHVIINGGAQGVDAIAKAWAEDKGYKVETYLAEWQKYGRRAGPLRNYRMLAEGPDLVIAFPGGRGTANMVKIAEEAGVDVKKINYETYPKFIPF